ncbi:hypothetical protein ASPACDRAFT_126732 [Aspergillus aculeatus ATCC 16872]|uniref:Uncharacterized protein n=1 Tax=Aspergillus aculeatus (strain ATCC 16872 / CBS 172.66 / WB 5094) TaxID=690307 RepID=A0A1L9WGX5_ASPA1|nr:uncharacterized protein ASPACDRAFT_126732 [Aspergillus aculeatus ATCC 16872]OJJ95403.1 hypothetical protein ASPACDRAFT_126732 [Aspergillus aculeatus ATCC 16872]
MSLELDKGKTSPALTAKHTIGCGHILTQGLFDLVTVDLGVSLSAIKAKTKGNESHRVGGCSPFLSFLMCSARSIRYLTCQGFKWKDRNIPWHVCIVGVRVCLNARGVFCAGTRV